MAVYPCRNCVYFEVCGSNTRTEECKGRQTKSEQKKKARSEESARKQIYNRFNPEEYEVVCQGRWDE